MLGVASGRDADADQIEKVAAGEAMSGKGSGARPFISCSTARRAPPARAYSARLIRRRSTGRRRSGKSGPHGRSGRIRENRDYLVDGSTVSVAARPISPTALNMTPRQPSRLASQPRRLPPQASTSSRLEWPCVGQNRKPSISGVSFCAGSGHSRHVDRTAKFHPIQPIRGATVGSRLSGKSSRAPLAELSTALRRGAQSFVTRWPPS